MPPRVNVQVGADVTSLSRQGREEERWGRGGICEFSWRVFGCFWRVFGWDL